MEVLSCRSASCCSFLRAGRDLFRARTIFTNASRAFSSCVQSRRNQPPPNITTAVLLFISVHQNSHICLRDVCRDTAVRYVRWALILIVYCEQLPCLRCRATSCCSPFVTFYKQQGIGEQNYRLTTNNRTHYLVTVSGFRLIRLFLPIPGGSPRRRVRQTPRAVEHGRLPASFAILYRWVW